MKKLTFVIAVCFILLSSAEIVSAEEPFVYISFKQEKVNLGSSLLWDNIIPEALTLKVNSNCIHGPIVASMSSLKNKNSNVINQDRVFIKTLATNGFVSLIRPVIISRPKFGSHDIIIDFMVKANGEFDLAGTYSGSMAFTVLPPV